MKKLPYIVDENRLIDGKSVGSSTLVGYYTKKYPIPNAGNCFGIRTDKKKEEFRIVNFGLENLEHLIAEKIIEWPIKILPISSRQAVILDPRIPEDYYWTEFCESCCPFDLLPLTQKLKIWDAQLKGDLSISVWKTADGREGYMSSRKIKAQPRKLKTKYTIEVAPMLNSTGIDLDAKMVNALSEEIDSKVVGNLKNIKVDYDEGYIYCPYIPNIKKPEDAKRNLPSNS